MGLGISSAPIHMLAWLLGITLLSALTILFATLACAENLIQYA
jgi:hypothetical protein